MPPLTPSAAAAPLAESVSVAPPAAWVSRVAVLSDLPAIEALHDQVFGPGALTRSAYRVREGQPPLSPYCRVLWHGDGLVSALRFTAIRIGGRGDALMLGPLAVAPAFANQGHGRRLVAEGLDAARTAGLRLVFLVGDPPYYARFGFKPVARGRIRMPGPVDPARLLVAELVAGAAEHYSGLVAAAGPSR
jgi:predicted N-acetyltransferase YhbS